MYMPPATNQVTIQGLKAQGVHWGEGGSSGGAEWVPAGESSADALSLQTLSLSPGLGGVSLSLAGTHSRSWGGVSWPPMLTGGPKLPGKADEKGFQGQFLVGVDWLSETFRPTQDDPVDVGQVQLAASLAMGCEPADWVELEHGTHGYHLAMLGPDGARLDWGAPGRDDFHLSLPGKACQAMGGEGMQGFLRFSEAHQGRPTRLDLAMDDYDRTVSPADLQAAVVGPDVVTHTRRWRTIEGGTVGEDSQPTGATCYLGAPASRVQLRVYDKGMESQGERDCIRWELQLRDEPAQAVLQELAAGRQWGQVWASHLVRFVDFRRASTDSNVTRRERVPWFQALVGVAEKALAYVPKPEKTMGQVLGWLKQSVAPSLALAMTFWNGDLGELVGLVDAGRLRWKPRHYRILAGAT